MEKILSVTILIICYFCLIINGEDGWEPPYFEDANVEGIEFSPTKITVEEELDVTFKLVYINYDGEPNDNIEPDNNIQPRIGKFTFGNNNYLNASIEYFANRWFIQINSRQDYEQKEQQVYRFEVYIGTKNDVTIEPQKLHIQLKNIFDNKPAVSYNGPCKAKELESNVSTNCIFIVHDLDGMRDNVIKIDIVRKYNDEEYFEFGKPFKLDDYNQYFYLIIKKALQYDQKPLHNFDVVATDIGNNQGNLSNAILEVINVPHKLPLWLQPLVMATFDEKTEQKFQLKAIDGDTGINKPICYKLEFIKDKNYEDIVEINKITGLLSVGKIDRDIRQQDFFNFSTCAFKCQDITSEICNSTIFIINDINDNLPIITIEPNVIFIHENISMTIPLQTFDVKDIDLGIHASYDVILDKPDDIDVNYSVAYDIIPKSGYQNASFKLIVSNKNFLDYETELWRNTTIKVIARETEFPENYTTFNLRINLINWNDEFPIFTKQLYNVSIEETFGNNKVIENVVATDRDYSDFVTHSIIGNFHGIKIYENGTVYTTAEDVFDYDRQKVVIIQIKATDNLITSYSQKLNEAITQLTINLIDVNNKSPEIRMPRTPPNITENSKGGTLITDLILGTDPDTTANLTFSIDWEKSYATKSGREADKDTYKNCFILETHPSVDSNNTVYGHLKVNPDFEKQVDYEKYENIYLLIRITDWAQVINADSSEGTLTITVDDLNDNAPEFILNTLNESRFVVEEATPKTLVGTILAIDIDGPGNNDIQYHIKPENGTLDRLIEIESKTGVLQVMENAIIDCDIPKIDYLYFKIILTDNDEVHTTEGSMKINVNDINNKIPQLENFDREVKIWENSTTGTPVGRIKANDSDRDPPHNVLQYLINFEKSPDLEKFFIIDQQNGFIQVQLGPNAELDRDNGITKHIIDINILDNYLDPKNGIKHTVPTTLTVILLDINDNAPEMPKPNQFLPKLLENAKAGFNASCPDFDNYDCLLIAKDKDEPNTPNSWVSYKIQSIKPGPNCNPSVSDYENLFGIIGDDKEYGQIFARKDLKGYYGSWHVNIEAFDHGDIPMRSNETYTVEIKSYNFNAPKIMFPTDRIIRLSHKQAVGRPLYNTDGTTLSEFEAYDPDGDENGNVTFHLSNYNENDADYFTIIQETRNKSRLEITKQISTRFYRVNVKASDGGRPSLSDELKNLNIVFIDMEGDPIFEIESKSFKTNFTETDLGLQQEREIPKAYDPKNQGIVNENDLFKIYYFIDDNQNEENSSFFSLNSETGILTLKQKLNRTAIEQHNFRIIATNNKNGPPSNPNKNSILQIIIDVIDVKDTPPVFDDRKYGSGIMTKDYVGKEIIKLHATDPDLDDPTTYLINDPIITHGNNIEEVKNKMFRLNKDTGSLTLTMVPKDNMKGYFEFNVTAIDTVNFTDVANVKIYIIAEDNRIVFIFLNLYALIKEKQIFLRETLEKEYGYDRCNIDGIVNTTESESTKQATDSSSTTDSVSLQVHFIKNNEAIEAIEIQKKSDKNLILKLKKIFGNEGLILNNIEHASSKEIEQNLEDLLITMLVVVSVVLGTLCTVLVIAYFFKTRAINRLLKAYEPTEFGSRASNLNRIGAPTTNVFSVEGSNPVINNNINVNDEFETSSIDSDGSDFVGINNDPNFIMNNESKSSKNSSIISNYESNASNTKNSFSDNDHHHQDIYDNHKKYSNMENTNDIRF